MELEGRRDLNPNLGSETLIFSRFEIKEEPQEIDEDGWYISHHSDSAAYITGSSPIDGLQRFEVNSEQRSDDEGYVTPAKKRVLTEEEKVKRRQASREWRAKRKQSDPNWHAKEAARISTLYVPKSACSEEKWNDYKQCKREAMTLHRARKHQPSNSWSETPEHVKLPITANHVLGVPNTAARTVHSDANVQGSISETHTSEQDNWSAAVEETTSNIKLEVLKVETVDVDADDGPYDREFQIFNANEQDTDGEPITCHVCSEEFWNIDLLTEHITNHHTGQTMDLGSTSCNSANLEKRNKSVSSCNEIDELYCEIEEHHPVDNVAVKPFYASESQSKMSKTCPFENERVYDEVTACHRNRADVLDHDNRSTDGFQEFANTPEALKFINMQKTGKIPVGQSKTLPVKPFPCVLCPKSFHRKFLLQSHYKTHKRQEERKCPICEKTFTRVSKLNHHIETHNGQNCPDDAVRCHMCQKTFSKASNLNRHLLIHKGEKSFQCEMCDRSFSDKSSLRNHQYTHTQEKAFHCEICDTWFKQKRCLVRHVFEQHHHQESYSSQDQSL